MNLPLTTETLAASYDYLRTTPPFNTWNLPESEDVTFRIIRDKKTAGYHKIINGRHIIAISSATIGRTLSLMETMAHEMIHMHQRNTSPKLDPRGVHNKGFIAMGNLACKIHGFDPLLF